MALRRIVPIALAASALIAAGCGGSSSSSGSSNTRGYSTSGTQLSSKDYGAKLKAISSDLSAKAQAASAKATSSDTGPLSDLVNSTNKAADDTAALNPPTKYQALNAAIVKGYRDVASASSDLIDAAKNKDAAKAKAAQAKLQQAQTTLQESIAKIASGG